MYNPSEPGKKGTLFGLPYSIQEAEIVILPIHLDATVSYQDGTALSPDTILDASTQLDLSLLFAKNPWLLKVCMASPVMDIKENNRHRSIAKEVVETLENGNQPDEDALARVNRFCEQVHTEIEKQCASHLAQGKLVGIIGGDHSSPLGLMQALASNNTFGILQIDAHMDLRNSYEGFRFSHASIMHNALSLEGVSSLTQVGIRDFCDEEVAYAKDSQKRISVFYDEQLFHEKMNGLLWADLTKQIIQTLPERVYVSLDVDGLDPSLCPNTGTPVPGGLGFNEVSFLLEALVKANKKIIGFDICETGNNPWDANVAARLLYRMAVCMGASNGLAAAQ